MLLDGLLVLELEPRWAVPPESRLGRSRAALWRDRPHHGGPGGLWGQRFALGHFLASAPLTVVPGKITFG